MLAFHSGMRLASKPAPPWVSPICLEYGLREPSVFKILLDPYESRVTHHLPPGLLDFPASSDQLPGFGPSPGD